MWRILTVKLAGVTEVSTVPRPLSVDPDPAMRPHSSLSCIVTFFRKQGNAACLLFAVCDGLKNTCLDNGICGVCYSDGKIKRVVL